MIRRTRYLGSARLSVVRMTVVALLSVAPVIEDSMAGEVAKAVDALEAYDVTYETNPMGTVIEAETTAELFAAAQAARRRRRCRPREHGPENRRQTDAGRRRRGKGLGRRRTARTTGPKSRDVRRGRLSEPQARRGTGQSCQTPVRHELTNGFTTEGEFGAMESLNRMAIELVDEAPTTTPRS